MKMILITWNYNGQNAAERTFAELGYDVERLSVDPGENLTDNPDLAKRFDSLVAANGGQPDFVFSHDYFPAVSDACEKLGMRMATA